MEGIGSCEVFPDLLLINHIAILLLTTPHIIKQLVSLVRVLSNGQILNMAAVVIEGEAIRHFRGGCHLLLLRATQQTQLINQSFHLPLPAATAPFRDSAVTLKLSISCLRSSLPASLGLGRARQKEFFEVLIVIVVVSGVFEYKISY